MATTANNLTEQRDPLHPAGAAEAIAAVAAAVVTGDQDSGWEPMPSYATMAIDIVHFYSQMMKRYWDGPYRFPRDISQDVNLLFKFSCRDVMYVVGLAIGFTIARWLLSKFVITPWCRYLALDADSAFKMPESVWRLIYYFCVWGYTFQIVVASGRYRFFQKPSSVWQDYSPKADIPSDMKHLYALQSAFYLHGLYGLFFLDAWRKDSAIMCLHHIVTIGLVWMSYVCRCHNVGALVMLFHDCCDVELEFAKINVYLKVRAGQTHKINDILAAIAFLSMTVTWFVCRLYYVPLKVLYACSTILLKQDVQPDYAMLFLTMLLLLTAMNMFWFWQMIMVLYKILSGDMTEVEDIREYEVVEKIERNHKRASKKKKVN